MEREYALLLFLRISLLYLIPVRARSWKDNRGVEESVDHSESVLLDKPL